MMRWVPTPKVQLGQQDTLVGERSHLGYVRSSPGASARIAEVLQRKVDPQRSWRQPRARTGPPLLVERIERGPIRFRFDSATGIEIRDANSLHSPPLLELIHV